MNRCIFIGRLTAEPQLRQTPQGVAVCKFTLAVNRPHLKNEENEADFITVVAWRSKAEFVVNYLHKGTKIVLEANARTRRYEKDGQTHFVTEFFADNIEFVESAGATNNRQSQQTSHSFEMTDFEDLDDANLPWEA